MLNLLKPCQLAFVVMAGWINRQQQQVIDYQQEQIRTLLEMRGGKRLRFTDELSSWAALPGGCAGRRSG